MGTHHVFLLQNSQKVRAASRYSWRFLTSSNSLRTVPHFFQDTSSCTVFFFFIVKNNHERECLVWKLVVNTPGREKENRLKLCPRTYFIQKGKQYSIDFITHLCILLTFIELQVTRNKTVNKMQSQLSKSPQSRMTEYPLGSIWCLHAKAGAFSPNYLNR